MNEITTSWKEHHSFTSSTPLKCQKLQQSFTHTPSHHSQKKSVAQSLSGWVNWRPTWGPTPSVSDTKSSPSEEEIKKHVLIPTTEWLLADDQGYQDITSVLLVWHKALLIKLSDYTQALLSGKSTLHTNLYNQPVVFSGIQDFFGNIIQIWLL